MLVAGSRLIREGLTHCRREGRRCRKGHSLLAQTLGSSIVPAQRTLLRLQSLGSK